MNEKALTVDELQERVEKLSSQLAELQKRFDGHSGGSANVKRPLPTQEEVELTLETIRITNRLNGKTMQKIGTLNYGTMSTV